MRLSLISSSPVVLFQIHVAVPDERSAQEGDEVQAPRVPDLHVGAGDLVVADREVPAVRGPYGTAVGA